MKVKVAAAISADQQAGKHIVFSIVGAALTDFAPLLLHLLIHSTLDDRLMDVLEHHPILTVIVDSLLILVGFGISFEIENVTTVFLQGENFGYCGAVPLGRRLLFALAGAFDALREPVGPRGQDIVLFKLGGNLLCSEPLQSHAVNAAHNLGCLVIHDPMLRIIRVLDVTIGRLAHRLTGIALDLIADAPLFADIAGIPLVHDIEKGRKVVFRLVGAVYAVVDGNEANAVLREGDLRIEAHTEVITTHATEVFYKDNAHLTGFNVGNQAFPIGPFKIRAAPTVVRIDRYIRKIPFTGIAREHILLMNDGITVPGKIIVAAQAAIDGGDFFL